jgi:hypothetical protein
MQLCVARIGYPDFRCLRCDNLFSMGTIPVSNLCIDFCSLCDGLTRHLVGATERLVPEGFSDG